MNIDELTICVNGVEISSRDCLIMVIGIPSSPGENLFSNDRIISFICFSFLGSN